ncbi:hypothetical protein ACRAWG_21585 [Methylobacterium sp. P31]
MGFDIGGGLIGDVVGGVILGPVGAVAGTLIGGNNINTGGPTLGGVAASSSESLGHAAEGLGSSLRDINWDNVKSEASEFGREAFKGIEMIFFGALLHSGAQENQSPDADAPGQVPNVFDEQNTDNIGELLKNAWDTVTNTVSNYYTQFEEFLKKEAENVQQREKILKDNMQYHIDEIKRGFDQITTDGQQGGSTEKEVQEKISSLVTKFQSDMHSITDQAIAGTLKEPFVTANSDGIASKASVTPTSAEGFPWHSSVTIDSINQDPDHHTVLLSGSGKAGEQVSLVDFYNHANAFDPVSLKVDADSVISTVTVGNDGRWSAEIALDATANHNVVAVEKHSYTVVGFAKNVNTTSVDAYTSPVEISASGSSTKPLSNKDASTNNYVDSIAYHGHNGGQETTGAFVETAPGQWLENGTFHYTTLSESASNVVLYDASRDVKIGLHLDTNKVDMTWSNDTAHADLYDILDIHRQGDNASAQNYNNTGHGSVNTVTYHGHNGGQETTGAFVETAPGQWLENGTFHYTTLSESASNVVLYDASRDVKIGLHLDTNKVDMTWSNDTAHADLYDILNTGYLLH